MSDHAAQPRAAPRDFQPATFAERGLYVPFTSPVLLRARLRTNAQGVRELVIRNPAGGEGWYVGHWHNLIDGARLSVHDRLLYRRIEAADAVQPLALRRVVREVALEGYAGRAARDAAEAAAAGEARALAATQATLLAKVGGCGEAGRARVAALAEVLAPIGLETGGDAPLSRDFADLAALVRALDEVPAWPRGLDPALPACVRGAAAATLRLANELRSAALGGIDVADGVLAAAAEPPLRRAALITRLAWVLDGWPALLAIWSDGTAGAAHQAGRILGEIAASLPPLPLEAGTDTPEPAATAPPHAIQPRRARASHDWLAGIAERDLIARNEALLARQL